MRATVMGVIPDLKELLIKFTEDFPVERGDILDVDLPKEKRSNNANAFYWKMLGKLAKQTDADAIALYKHQIRDMSVYNVMTMHPSSLKMFEKCWCSGHTGRFIETRSCDTEDEVVVLAYYGSSDFSRKEMYRLTEHLKEDLKLHNIPYDEDEIRGLISAWQG